MEILTLGFTKRSARSFFDALKAARVTRLVDVRLNNVSQLAGFTKRDDLAYFLDDYKKHRVPWSEYERSFLSLMAERRIEDRIPRALFDGRAVLLCSEPTADHCHRRLVAEYLRDHWGDVEVTHL